MAHVVDRWHTKVKEGGRTCCQVRGVRPTARHGKGLRWAARWIPLGGTEESKSFATKTDADAFAIEVARAELVGEQIDRSSRMTVAELALEVARSRPVSVDTLARLLTVIHNDIEPTALGKMAPRQVQQHHVQAWVTDRSAVLARSTLFTEYTFLRAVFVAAVRRRLISRTPCEGVVLPEDRTPEVVPLEVEQVQALAAAVAPHVRAMVIAQATLGLRVGELIALTDRSVRPGEVRVEHQLGYGTRKAKFLPPKSRHSVRTVPMPVVCAQALAAHMAAYPPRARGLLFTTRDGLPWRRDGYGKALRRGIAEVNRAAEARLAEIRAGSTEPELPSIPTKTTSHDLRHHYASVLLLGGISVVEVARRLGHASAALVLKTYGHMLSNREAATRAAIDGAWSDEPAPAPETGPGRAEEAS
jgi:integrase